MNDNNEILYKKLLYFQDNDIPVHIKKNDGRFSNGIILELAKDLLILDDEVLGGVPIYFDEILFIERRGPKL